MSDKRVFLIVLDSFGIGEMEDAPQYGDEDVNTLRSVAASSCFHVPNLERLGLFRIDGVADEPVIQRQITVPESEVIGRYGRMAELSCGKDTTIGHWEIAGLVSDRPLPTYPQGFPASVIDEFSRRTGRGVLCNLPYSGTQVIQEYGDAHMNTGDLIVYTSADSVFQIAAHEDIVPVEQLYEYCRVARDILRGEHGVGRVIARPFTGPAGGSFVRTPRRHDFSLEPPGVTMLDQLSQAGKSVIAVGKIQDIFAGRGITEYGYTSGNDEGIQRTLTYLDQDFEGLCFVNLVDYDMLYGHRRDVDGYARALTAFDERLPEIMGKMRPNDLLLITADHGCDPAYTRSTDHTREHVPLLIYGKAVRPGNMGTRKTFADISATVLQYFGIPAGTFGEALLPQEALLPH